MKLAAGIVLLLMIPMIFLYPFGRPSFLGYYTGVIATWSAYVIGLKRGLPKDNRGAGFKLTHPRA